MVVFLLWGKVSVEDFEGKVPHNMKVKLYKQKWEAFQKFLATETAFWQLHA